MEQQDKQKEEQKQDGGQQPEDQILANLHNDADAASKKWQEELKEKSKLHQNELVKTVCNLNEESDIFSSFMNQYNGSGSVMTQCKHYAHLECLRKYHLQQIALGEDDE